LQAVLKIQPVTSYAVKHKTLPAMEYSFSTIFRNEGCYKMFQKNSNLYFDIIITSKVPGRDRLSLQYLQIGLIEEY